MIRLVLVKQKPNKPLQGLIYYHNGRPVGVIKVLVRKPKKGRPTEEDWEEVEIEGLG